MEDEKKLIINTLSQEKVTTLMKAWYQKFTKSSKESSEERDKGNKIYTKVKHTAQDHENIWKFYSNSIAKAPKSSEDLAIAYGNRSALLFHLKKYQESIIDIDRALEITNSNPLKVKLLARKDQCLLVLENHEKESYAHLKELNNFHFDKKKLEFLPIYSHSNTEDIDISNEFQTFLSIKEANDPLNLVSLRYNEKYGRHLVANKDIKPGEIIIVDKPYFKCANLNNIYAFCSHCLKTSWTNIPCDQCSYNMYCSEECKKEAWAMYHEIECVIIPYILCNQVADYWKQLAVRTILIAITKAGTIAKLREDLKKVDNSFDEIHKCFSNKKLSNNQFTSLYNLSCNVDASTLEKHLDHAVITLVALAKSSLIFGDSNKFHSGKDLIVNKDVVFIGSLLLRMMKISDINAHCVMEGSSVCRFSNSLKECENNRCCERGVCLTTIPSLINHSCNPNVRKCFTEDMHMIVYALQPIKKNSQLFDSYVGSFFDKSFSERQSALQHFNFECTCISCKKKWPQVLLSKNYLPDIKKMDRIEFKLYEKYKNLIFAIDDSELKYTLDTLKDLSKDIEEATTYLNPPSYLIAWLITAFSTTFNRICGLKLEVPSKCN